MLSIEEEDGGGQEADVKVLDVERDVVHVHTINGRHLGKLLGRLGQLHTKYVASLWFQKDVIYSLLTTDLKT